MRGDRVERALRERGPRELKGAGVSPLPADVDEARARLRAVDRRRRFRSLAGGGLGTLAAAAAVIAVAVALTGTPKPAPGAGAGGSGTPSATAFSAAATPVPTATPAPTAPPSSIVPACDPSSLSATAEPWGAAAGSRGTLVTVSNTSGVACSVSGSPGARLSSGGVSLAQTAPDPATSKPLRLSPGSSAVTSIIWANRCDPVPSGQIDVTLVLTTGALPVTPDPTRPDVLVPPCMGPNDRNTLSTISFQPPPSP